MRFAAVVVRPKQPAPAPATEPIRLRVPAEFAMRTELVAPRPQEVPAELDQRVRLIGEW
jgi:hypothetical protein